MCAQITLVCFQHLSFSEPCCKVARFKWYWTRAFMKQICTWCTTCPFGWAPHPFFPLELLPIGNACMEGMSESDVHSWIPGNWTSIPLVHLHLLAVIAICLRRLSQLNLGMLSGQTFRLTCMNKPFGLYEQPFGMLVHKVTLTYLNKPFGLSKWKAG
jgi:hypothetical protein